MSYSVETVAEEHRVPVIQKCRRFPEAEIRLGESFDIVWMVGWI
jgi:hypothetical protein